MTDLPCIKTRARLRVNWRGPLIAAFAVVALLVAPAASREHNQEEARPAKVEQPTAPATELDEAAAEFEIGDFVAPPRTINGLLAKLLTQIENFATAQAEPKIPTQKSWSLLLHFLRQDSALVEVLGSWPMSPACSSCTGTTCAALNFRHWRLATSQWRCADSGNRILSN